MAYAPVTWVEKVTKVGPTNMNHLELGLQAAAVVADAALPTPAGSNGQFLKKIGGVWVPTSFAASDIPNFPSDVTKALRGDGSWALMPGAELSYAQGTGVVTVSSTTEATGTAIVTAGAVVVDGSTSILVEFFASAVGGATTGAATLGINLFEGATQITRLAEVDLPTGSHDLPVYAAYRFTPANGSHTYAVTGYKSGAWTTSPIVVGGSGGTGGYPPLFVRITKV